MRSTPRRFHFQLTPLLDLLLIVIFAQFLEITQQAERQTVESERQVASRQSELQQEYARLREQAEQERESLRDERAQLTQSEEASQAAVAEMQRQLEEVVAQQQQAADLIAELFRVPEELIDEALKPVPIGAPSRSASENERLRERFRELASLRGSEVVEHVLSYDELRKRADIWNVRIEEGGEITFSPGTTTLRFRASNPNEFASRLFDRYKSMPQPKGLVVLLVSYGDARADVRQAVLNGLPEAVRLMREDRLGRTQFEYAVLGYIPERDTN